MTKSYGQTFMPTTSKKKYNFCNYFNIYNYSEEQIFQNAFLQVRSDECGLFA
jgi:hypothetical protein